MSESIRLAPSNKTRRKRGGQREERGWNLKDLLCNPRGDERRPEGFLLSARIATGRSIAGPSLRGREFQCLPATFSRTDRRAEYWLHILDVLSLQLLVEHAEHLGLNADGQHAPLVSHEPRHLQGIETVAAAHVARGLPWFQLESLQ